MCVDMNMSQNKEIQIMACQQEHLGKKSLQIGYALYVELEKTSSLQLIKVKNISKQKLEKVYKKYNKRELVNPDPLVFLYNYPDVKDREIAGLIAATLAYGRVAQILKNVSKVLNVMGSSPKTYLLNSAPGKIKKDLKGFKHRFTTDQEMSALLIAIKKALQKYGSLEALFLKSYKNEHKDILTGLSGFVAELKKLGGIKKSSLLSDPTMESACKRLNLYLRWMVRCDKVDPGGWKKIPTSKLIVPLDTHMFQFGKCYGFTQRKNAGIKAALEITGGFRKLSPQDPIKYDFAVTRFGIRSDMCWQLFENIK